MNSDGVIENTETPAPNVTDEEVLKWYTNMVTGM
jgi:hypothetical protein